MKIVDLLTERSIMLNASPTSKQAAIDLLVELMATHGNLSDKEAYKAAVLKREAEGTTGIGEGIAIPHAKTSAVKSAALAAMVVPEGVDYQSLDGEPAKLLFLIAAPNTEDNVHLEVLGRLSALLMDENFYNGLLNASSVADFLAKIDAAEKERFPEEAVSAPEAKAKETDKGKIQVLAVTACPTGIAHTYMAAEALTKAAQEMGHEIKIETQGVEVENILSDNDIQSADIVIIACQKTVDLSRFEGKRVTEVPIERAVKNPQKVIQDAIDGKNISIFELAKEDKAKKKAQQTGIYKHLMSGVNFMLPFVISGGILIAFSFMFGIKASDPNDPSFNVIAKALSDIGGGAAFGMMVPMLAAGIAYSIAGKQGMCSGMVAGVIAKSIGAGFLGGLIGAIFAGYLTKTLMEKIHLPKAIQTLKGLILVPLISVFITGMFMIFIVGEPVKFLLDGLTNYLNSMDSSNGVIFGLIIGAMMASDMGGPINKAISTFSIALMSTGVYAPIAACMVAGMTPPLGLALATVLFKKRFTKEEREAGKSCWVLGLSYITEGAIPFAVADPIRVIPALMLGSAVAGAISLGAGCASLAPHGGIWILPIPNVITNLPMYVLALVAGSIVTCLSVALLKRKNNYED